MSSRLCYLRFAVLIVAVWAMGLAGARVARAQEFRATITGEVSDPSERAVPSASITAIQTDTRQTYTAKTNSDGVFSLPDLLPGNYTVTVTAPGFKKKFYNHVVLESAQVLKLNVALAVGSVAQTVIVSASPGLLNTSTASGGGVADNTQVQHMATGFENPFDQLIFTPGLTIPENSATFEISTLRAGTYSYSAEGSVSGHDAWYIDGAPDSTLGGGTIVPSQDAVQELQTSVPAYDTQYGWTVGAVMGATIKSGTNRFHGDIYEYYENQGLNANSIQDDVSDTPKPINISNRYGGTIGGPIQKGKTFFFFSYDGWRQDQPEGSIESVPTAAMRSGDFTGTGYTIYNPNQVTCTKGTTSNCSTWARTAFPNDTIPQSDISPIGAAIMSLYPAPNLPGITDNYAQAGPRNLSYSQYLGRVDHSFSDKLRVYTTFIDQDDSSNSAGNGFPGPGSTASMNPDVRLFSIFDVTDTLTPSTVADFKVSYSRYSTDTVTGVTIPQNYNAKNLGGLTMPSIPTTTHQDLAPEISLSDFEGEIGNTSSGSADNNWYISPSIAEVKGHHMMHYGFEFMGYQSGALGIPGTPNGTFDFTGQWTQENPLAAATGSGLSIADALLGYPESGSVEWNENIDTAFHEYGLYFQDDYSVRKNLTLNLGLRWDADTSPSERYNRLNAGFCLTCTNPYTSQIDYAKYPNLPNPLTGGYTFAGVNGVSRAPYWVYLNNWQPRFGFAYSITPKTVLRGGFGIFYQYDNDPTPDVGFSQTTSYIESTDADINPTNYFVSGTPFPSGVLAPTGASEGLETDAGDSISYDTTGRDSPWTQHWTLDVQRQLPGQIMLDVGYAGSHVHGMSESQSQGIIGLTGGKLQTECFQNNAICNDSVPNPFYGVLPAAASLGAASTIPTWELQRSYPLFDAVSQSDDPIGYSNYNALMVTAQRKISSLDFIFNYTYANWMAATSYLNNGNWRDANLWYGPYSDDVRHYIDATAVWPLPFGRGTHLARNAKGLLGGLINGWQFDPSFVYMTGLPFSVPSASLVGGPGCTSYAPANGQTIDHWFNNNTSCYKSLADWQARTAPLYLGYLREPLSFVPEAALQKQFALPREGMFLQARIESTDVTNTPQWGTPNTTNTELETCSTKVCSGFGTITPSDTARYVFVSLKILF